MVTYEIQGPDGKTYSIDGPEGASREDVIAAIQARMQAQPTPAAETKPATTEAAPIEEATKGAKSGVSALKSMWEGAGIAKDVGVASQALKSLDLYSQIDKGALNRSNLTPAVAGGDMSPQFRDAQIYLAADEKKRQQLRERATSEIQNRKDFVAAAVKTIQQYQEENKKNKGRTENLTDVEGAKDFANWLSFNVGSGAVQMAPVMLAAISTGGIGAYLVGTGMELGGATQNRLEFILNKTKDETNPEKRAKAIFDYVQKTNDASLAQAIASGAVDVLLGPVADVIKTPLKQAVREKTRKEIAKQIPKAVARQTGEEGIAGGTQETIAIAVERALEEQTGDALTKENIKRVVNAAAAEAVGGGGVSTVTGAARVALGPKTEEAAPRVEPTTEPAAPVTPAAPADPRKEALVKSYVDQGFMPDDADLLATQALGGLEPAAPTAQPAAPAVAEEAPAFLPKELAGAKPRYAFGNKLFELSFESDIDRAAYISAQGTPSKRDADYVDFVTRATGMSEPEVRAHGRAVRDAIKAQARASETGGKLNVAEVGRARKPAAPSAAPQQPEVQNVPTTEPPPFVTEPSTDERGVPVPNEPAGAAERPATAIDRGLGAAGSAARQFAGREEAERAALEKRQELAERTLSRGFATQPYPDLGVVLGAGWVRNELTKSPTPEEYQEAAYARLEELGGIPPADAAPAFERRAPAAPMVGERPEARAERPVEVAPTEAVEAPAAAEITEPVTEEPRGTETPKTVEAKTERPAQPTEGAAPLELEAGRKEELEVEPEVDIALKNIDEHMKAVYGTTAAGTARKRGAGAGRPETGAAKTAEQRTEQAKDINQLNRDIATAVKAADKLAQRQAPEAFATPEEYEYQEEARAQKLDQVRMALYGAAQRARTRPITGYIKAAEYLRKLKPAEQQRAKDLFEGKIKPSELPPKPTTKTTEGQRKKAVEALEEPVTKKEAVKEETPAAKEVSPWDNALKITDGTFDAKDAKKMTFDDLAALTQAAMELAAEQHTQDTDKTFAQLDTLAGALAYIAQRGTPLDAGMAEALLTGENGELVKNVSLYAVKPLREGQEATVMHKALDGAYGSYVPRTDRTGGVVLLEDSGKVRSGLNNLTVLHEGVHAVTSLKLFYIEAMEAAGQLDEVDDRLLDAYNELNELMVQANGAAADMMRNGTLPKEVTELARKDAFTDVHEFVAYGLTDANMKAFLLTVPGIGTKKSGLSRFISALLKLLQIGKDNASALRDLVIVSGKFMEAKTPEAKAMAEAYQRSVNTVADEIKQQKKTGTKAQEQTKTVKKAEEKLKAAATATEVVEQMGSLMQVAKNPSLWIDYLKVNYRNIATPVYKGYLSVLPTNVLVDLAEAFTIGNVKQLNSAVQKMHTFRTKTLHKVQELAVPWIKLNAKEQKKLADVMHMATDLQVDPAKNKTNALLNSRWNALTPEAKAVYTKVRDFYKGNYDLYRALLAKRVSDTPINNADRQSLMNAIKETYETGAKIEPYFPFMRYGEYWVSFGKGVNKEFYMFESPGERDLFRDRRAAELKRRDPNIEIEAGNDVSAMRKNLQGDSANLKSLFGLVDNMQVSDPDIKNTLKNEIFQLHLLTLPEVSFRKQFIKRKGTAGFSGDALRNFIASGTRFANQIARIKYGPEIRNSLSAAEASLEGDPDRPQKSMVTNELGLRMKDELEPEFKNTALDTISRGVNKAAFVWLLTSVHSAANQLFSLANFTLPTLAKYHGWGPATAQLTSTIANMYTQVGTTTLDKEGNVTYTPPTMLNNRSLRLTPLEQRAYQAMLDRGIADATRTYDLFLRKGQPTATYNDKKEKVVNALGALFHSAESMSREVTFMTAFRLNIRKMPFEDAVENAIHTVNESLFDYSPWNAPRVLKSAPARIVTQFMKFPLFVSIYLLRNARAMMKPMDGESRTAAAKALFGTLGITGVLAGVSGLPLFSTFMGLAQGLRNLMADDDEEIVLEEDDLMRWFRNVWLPETFGDTTVMGMNLAELIDSGVLNTATGFDFASGISLNNMWFRDAPEASNWKDAYATSVNSMLGPGVGLGESWASAIDDINKGDTLKGFEKLTPALFRGSLTAARYKTEGAIDAALRPIKEADEFTYGQLLMQAMGFKTTGLAKVMEDNFAIRQMQQKILQKRTNLISNLDRATTMDREADFEKTLEKIDEYNMKYPSPDLRIDYEDIQNAMERRRKAMRMTERGMIQDPRFRDLEVLRERGLELIEKEAAE